MRAPEEELKRLLLASELDLLEQIRKRCDGLQARVGDDPGLKDSVRRVIVEVLRESGLHDHDRLARALAPLIVSSMREEIRNSRDIGYAFVQRYDILEPADIQALQSVSRFC